MAKSSKAPAVAPYKKKQQEYREKTKSLSRMLHSGGTVEIGIQEAKRRGLKGQELIEFKAKAHKNYDPKKVVAHPTPTKYRKPDPVKQPSWPPDVTNHDKMLIRKEMRRIAKEQVKEGVQVS